jgi:hypothetical protein
VDSTVALGVPGPVYYLKYARVVLAFGKQKWNAFSYFTVVNNLVLVPLRHREKNKIKWKVLRLGETTLHAKLLYINNSLVNLTVRIWENLTEEEKLKKRYRYF